MILAEVMDDLAAALDTVEGLRVTPYPPDAVNVGAFPSYPENIAVLGDGLERWTLPVEVLESTGLDRTARDRLSARLADIWAALESYAYDACDSVKVTGVDFGWVTTGEGSKYLNPTFTCEVMGTGEPAADERADLLAQIATLQAALTALTAQDNGIIQNTVTIINTTATGVGTYAFYFYPTVTRITGPQVTTIAASAFWVCNALTRLDFPAAVNFGVDAFHTVPALTRLDVYGPSSFGTTLAFSGTFPTGLVTLVLRRTDAVITFGSGWGLASTGIGTNASARIYVPDALVAAYKAAPGWSTYAAKIVPLSTVPA